MIPLRAIHWGRPNCKLVYNSTYTWVLSINKKMGDWVPPSTIYLVKKYTPVIEAKGTRKNSKRKIIDGKERERIYSNTEDSSCTSKTEKTPPPSRKTVLKACFITSGALAAGGIITRQASHILADFGYWTADCTKLIPFDFLPWHLVTALTLVVSVSSLRFLALRIWKQFADSSAVANEQVLSSLALGDIVAVAFASGISEELLFRGALLPLVGVDYKGVIVAGVIFGSLHVTGGRNAAFAMWASVVGILYGVAVVYTHDLYVPMLSHSLANLVAAFIWKYKEEYSKL